jgi:hypothetical protein
MTVTFKLERLDGTPAEPASIETTILSWQPATGSRWTRRGGFRWSAFATTTPTRHPFWSLRTWFKTGTGNPTRPRFALFES